jgi:fatty-acyl-CoA synthase
MNTRLSPQEVTHILKDSEARMLLVDAQLTDLVDEADANAMDTVVIEDTGEDDDPYEQLLASGSPEGPESWLEDESEPISINYTSGSTGKSKGAIYTHRGPTCARRASRTRSGSATTRCTCGPCRCSTATAGA